MNCPKCGQAAIVRDEEGDDHCYMCSYNSARRMPTLEELKASEKHVVYGSYAQEPEFVQFSFTTRSLREPLPLLKRRSINWNTRGIKTKTNRVFNRQALGHGRAK